MNKSSDAADYFLDPDTRERLPDDAVFDAHGVDLVGADEEGLWWGTERAAWVLCARGDLVRVSGWLGASTWDGFFIGSAAQAERYAESHGVRHMHIETLDE